jgi:anaerobic magnesium-protoporphyrin IX monomethyl ester cyclase
MKVTLINPPNPSIIYSRLLTMPHLGLAYLASILHENNIEVNAIDFTVEKFDEAMRKIKENSADVWGITSVAYTYKNANAIAKIIKKHHPESKVVLGGHTVASLYESALQSNPSIDAVVIGEGEYTFLDLVRSYEGNGKLEDVDGIAYRTQNSIRRNKDRALIKNLDDLPFPFFKVFPLERYKTFWRPSPLPIASSRGCKFRCEFCDVQIFYRGKYRERSPENVVDEMENDIHKYGRKSLFFSDDIFTLNQKRTKKICEEIRRRKLDVQWACETRVDAVNKELLKSMKDAGCWAIFFGVESSSQETLNSMRKGFILEKTRKAFQACREVGIRTCASLMMFYPTDKKNTVEENIRFVKSLDPDIAYFAVTTPFPGTELYERLMENKMIKDCDFNHFDTLNPVFETEEFTMPFMRKALIKAYLSFYLDPLYLLKQFIRNKRDVIDVIIHAFGDYFLQKLLVKGPKKALQFFAEPL